jgi:hypothetical protein
MEHFTVDQTCRHGGCETAIMFVISRDNLANQPHQLVFINIQVCPTRQPRPCMTIYSFFALISRPALIRSSMFSRSLSSFNFVMTTLEG